MIAIPTIPEKDFLSRLGLNHHPFPVTPDDENFFMSEHIEQVLTEIIQGVLSRKGFMILTGEVGLGKTTLGRRILNILEFEGVETSLVLHTGLQDIELLAQINRDFGIARNPGQGASMNLVEQLNQLNDFLLAKNREGKNCTIIIDDAQNLSEESLELIRMISNLEAGCRKLVQILLIGQSELKDRLAKKSLRQLNSRIVVAAQAQALSIEELGRYVELKLNMAGNNGQLRIHPSAPKKLYGCTRGNFRELNLLMDRVLWAACLHEKRQIDRRLVQMAQNDLRPKRLSIRSRLLAAAGVLAMATLAFGTSWQGDQPGVNDGIESAVQTQTFAIDRPEPEPARVRAKDGGILPQPAAPDSGSPDESGLPVAEQAPAGALKTFLVSYDLEGYHRLFQTALQEEDIQTVARKIRRDTGYQLVKLNRRPQPNAQLRQIYAHIDPSSGDATYFLFWRPPFTIENFYYYYTGEEIRSLQRMLANVGLYTQNVDNIVGTLLMQAVIKFQHQSGVPITGYPDDTTLFLLSQAKENGTNG